MPEIVFRKHPTSRNIVQAVHKLSSAHEQRLRRTRDSQGATAVAAHESQQSSLASSAPRRAQAGFNATATISDVVFPHLEGSSLYRIHTAAKLCITSFPDMDFEVS